MVLSSWVLKLVWLLTNEIKRELCVFDVSIESYYLQLGRSRICQGFFFKDNLRNRKYSSWKNIVLKCNIHEYLIDKRFLFYLLFDSPVIHLCCDAVIRVEENFIHP